MGLLSGGHLATGGTEAPERLYEAQVPFGPHIKCTCNMGWGGGRWCSTKCGLRKRHQTMSHELCEAVLPALQPPQALILPIFFVQGICKTTQACSLVRDPARRSPISGSDFACTLIGNLSIVLTCAGGDFTYLYMHADDLVIFFPFDHHDGPLEVVMVVVQEFGDY